ncbi:MAG: hypothetical protein OEZ02_14095, partial [Anaerolineae bacterium]|nr:hypothetical protein [Anaerolineae bacterium]
GKLSKPTPLSELHIPLEQVIGFHLMPPHEQAPTYDPEAPNRKMEPVTIMVGPFHFNAVIRMATQTTLPKFLEVAKGDFLQVYEAEIIHPQNPDMQPIRVKTADVRRQQVAFAGRI